MHLDRPTAVLVEDLALQHDRALQLEVVMQQRPLLLLAVLAVAAVDIDRFSCPSMPFQNIAIQQVQIDAEYLAPERSRSS